MCPEKGDRKEVRCRPSGQFFLAVLKRHGNRTKKTRTVTSNRRQEPPNATLSVLLSRVYPTSIFQELSTTLLRLFSMFLRRSLVSRSKVSAEVKFSNARSIFAQHYSNVGFSNNTVIEMLRMEGKVTFPRVSFQYGCAILLNILPIPKSVHVYRITTRTLDRRATISHWPVELHPVELHSVELHPVRVRVDRERSRLDHRVRNAAW